MIFYAKSSCGFYSTEINGINIPADAIEITSDEHNKLLEGQSLGKIISSDADGRPILIDVPDAGLVPIVVSPRQIRQALTFFNLRTSVESAISASDQDTKDWYEFSTAFEENHQIVVNIASALSVSDENLHELFVKAASL